MSPPADLDIAALRRWIGREKTATDTIRAQPVAFMRATLGRAGMTERTPSAAPQDGDPLPPGWHWLFFLEAAPGDELGADGHAQRGDFLPPVPLPRRMWAGGRLEFSAPLAIGERITRRSVVRDIVQKTGRSGVLCLVTVRHEFFCGAAPRMAEEHDIVYRQAAVGAAHPPPAAPTDAALSEQITADSALLFRYSALTFNSHRIHYDLRYCCEVEGHAGLIVHGPLTATLLAALAARHCGGAALAGFAFRAVSPLIGGRAFSVSLKPCAGGLNLWATNPQGELAMSAEATLRAA